MKWLWKRVRFLGLGLLLAAPLSAADWGDFTGTLTYDGAAPVRPKLVVDKDLECCGKYLDEIVDETVTVGPKGGLVNVFVYVRLERGKKITWHPDLEKAAAKPVVLDNFHCRFQPHAVAVWGGKQTLLSTNSDPIGHAVKMDFLKNAPVNNLLPPGAKLEMKFQQAESLPTQVSCGPHPWERAYVKVHDSPYFAVTDAEGKFSIPKLPAGEWEFQLWHEKVGFLEAKPAWAKGRFKFTIKAGTNDLGTVKVPASVFAKK